MYFRCAILGGKFVLHNSITPLVNSPSFVHTPNPHTCLLTPQPSHIHPHASSHPNPHTYTHMSPHTPILTHASHLTHSLQTLLSGSMTSPQVLVSASEAFAKIVECSLVTNHVTTETILPIILSQLDNRDPSVYVCVVCVCVYVCVVCVYVLCVYVCYGA